MGCALTLEALMNSRIDPDETLNRLLLIDPCILARSEEGTPQGREQVFHKP